MLTTKKHKYPAWIEIDLKAVKHNYLAIKRFASAYAAKGISILPVVKADAYGHGMERIARLLNRAGVEIFGVSDVSEGIALRKSGIKKPILLLETSFSSCVKEIIDYNLIPTVCSLSFAKALNRYAKSVNKKINVHVKIDTGMRRLGVWYQEVDGFLQEITNFSHLKINGIYTHFPLADMDPVFTKRQIKRLSEIVRALNQAGIRIPYVHAANSMGLIYKTDFLNLARPGLMLYGLYPSAKLKKRIKLQPVMSVKARVLLVKKIAKGQGLSYGHTFVAKKNMAVATLSIGYSDGYMRCLSNKASVVVRGQRCPVLGNVTMDQIMIDVSKVRNVEPDMEVTILGKEKGACVSADELASQAGTINYEVVCSLGNQLPGIYKG